MKVPAAGDKIAEALTPFTVQCDHHPRTRSAPLPGVVEVKRGSMQQESQGAAVNAAPVYFPA